MLTSWKQNKCEKQIAYTGFGLVVFISTVQLIWNEHETCDEIKSNNRLLKGLTADLRLHSTQPAFYGKIYHIVSPRSQLYPPRWCVLEGRKFSAEVSKQKIFGIGHIILVAIIATVVLFHKMQCVGRSLKYVVGPLSDLWSATVYFYFIARPMLFWTWLHRTDKEQVRNTCLRFAFRLFFVGYIQYCFFCEADIIS